MPIYQWSDIKENFSDALLLGNGASMAIHRDFGYQSLFEAAQQHQHITPDVATIFTKFASTTSNLCCAASGKRKLSTKRWIFQLVL